MPASSRSSSALGSSITGDVARCAGAVKPEVAPFGGASSNTGDARISSREGIGRLSAHRSVKTRIVNWCGKDVPVLAPDLACCAGLSAHLCAKGVNLFDDEPLHALNRVFLLKPEIKCLWSHQRLERSVTCSVRQGKRY